MVSACFLERVLLGPAGFIQGAILRFEFAPESGDLLVDFIQRRFLKGEFLFRLPACLRAAESRAHDFRALLGQLRAFGAQAGGLRVDIRRRRNLRLQLRDLLEQLLIGGVIILQTAFHSGEFTVAKFDRRFRLAAAF